MGLESNWLQLDDCSLHIFVHLFFPINRAKPQPSVLFILLGLLAMLFSDLFGLSGMLFFDLLTAVIIGNKGRI